MVSSSLGRRVASITQSSQSESPSCSPFGKKKKCKDKYLAKHSSSKCEQGNGLHPQPWPSLLPLARGGSVLHGSQIKQPSCVGSGTSGGYPTAVSFFESLLQSPHTPQVATAISPCSSVVPEARADSHGSQAPSSRALLRCQALALLALSSLGGRAPGPSNSTGC